MSYHAAVKTAMPQVVTWRRDFHQHPELSNRETRTSQIVADELRKLGLEVRTGIAHTGGSSPTQSSACTCAEDYAHYAQHVPAFFYFVGVTPHGQDAPTAPSNHSPKFFVDEGSLPVALRTLLGATVDFLQQGSQAQ